MKSWMHRLSRLAAAAVMTGTLISGASGTITSAPPAHAGGNYVVALSNSFLGNTWRKTMVDIFEYTAKQAKAQGVIKDYRIENTAENTATEQIAQIKSLILQHVNAIVVNSASPSALNPVITQACKAGITVVVFDSLASAPCEYDLADSLYQYGFQEGHYVAAGMHGVGNVIVARGVVGSAPEAIIYGGQLAALKAYPKIKIVSTVTGMASDSVTQQAILSVLPSLPAVQGVITGGSSFGAIQAFQKANRALPIVAFDNAGEALRYWQTQHAKNGFTAVSLRTEPGQAAAAFWEAVGILQGQKLPKLLTFPNVVITQATLDKWVKVVPVGRVAAYLWTQADFKSEVARIQGKMALSIPAIPTVPIP